MKVILKRSISFIMILVMMASIALLFSGCDRIFPWPLFFNSKNYHEAIDYSIPKDSVLFLPSISVYRNVLDDTFVYLEMFDRFAGEDTSSDVWKKEIDKKFVKISNDNNIKLKSKYYFTTNNKKDNVEIIYDLHYSGNNTEPNNKFIAQQGSILSVHYTYNVCISDKSFSYSGDTYTDPLASSVVFPSDFFTRIHS